MRLANPEFLYLLILLIPVVYLYIRREKKSRPAVTYSALSLLDKLPVSIKSLQKMM